jgi:hypothetical protein
MPGSWTDLARLTNKIIRVGPTDRKTDTQEPDLRIITSAGFCR